MDDGEFPGLLEKAERLRNILRETGGCVIAYSGGVDSSYLLAEAVGVLGLRALAITVVSPVQTTDEILGARELAFQLGANHREVEFDELLLPSFKSNPPDRCYHCKLERGKTLVELAKMEGYSAVFDGTNSDDGDDYRPGHRALKELGIKSPLAMAGLAKAEVRELSRRLGLPTWSRPAYACLATRFPYGVEITAEGLRKVERAEKSLRELGLRIVRVRVHGEVARIETGEDELDFAAGKLRGEVSKAVKDAGFSYAALDLTGYRTGSMNETLSAEEMAS